MPEGTLSLTTVKGFEFWPKEQEVEIRGGEVTHVEIRLERMTDMAAKGWYSGSTHMHMNYGGNLYNTLENLMFMSAAEDQDVVNELIANKDNRILDYQYFIPGGGAHPLSTPDRLLMVGQEYRPPFYGHVTLIGLRDHLLSPWATGYEGTAVESLYPSNTDMLRKAKAQHATTGYAHAFFGEEDPIDRGLGVARGFIVDAALDTTDGVEWSFSGRAAFHPWYAVLNNGLRVTATGGEICPEPRVELFREIDAANVDLKAFTEQFYRKLCASELAPVLDTLEFLARETDVWLEITTLLIPGENDSEAEIDELTSWVADRLGPEVPLHFTAFHPDYRMLDTPPTPPETLRRAREIGLGNGLHYVYTGNVRDLEGGTTRCRACGIPLVERDGYELVTYRIDDDGACRSCGTPCPGRFAGPAGTWGARRLPIVP